MPLMYIICYMAYSTVNHQALYGFSEILQLLRRQDKSRLIHVRPHPEWTKASEKSMAHPLGYRVFNKKHRSIASKISRILVYVDSFFIFSASPVDFTSRTGESHRWWSADVWDGEEKPAGYSSHCPSVALRIDTFGH